MLRILFVFLFSATAVILYAQNPALAALTIPAELRENAKSVVRDYREVYRATSRNSATLEVRRVITVIDDGHNRENQLVVYYDNDTKITRFKATLYDALGQKIREAKKSEIEDVRALSGGQFYTDSRVKTVTLTHQTYPYTVEFEYELKMTDFGAAGSQRWQPQGYDQSVERSSFTAYVHQGNELRYRANGLPDPSVGPAGDGYTRMEWKVENLPAHRTEALAPPSTVTLPFLETALADFTVDDYELTNRDWRSYGKQMLQLHQDIRTLPPELEEEVLAAVEGLTTTRDKIAALYRLLQGRTRYVGVQLGIGGWQPFSAQYVEQNRFGDCKALSNYMGAMLDVVGVDNYPVLVHWSDQPSLLVEPDFTASAFNHMILYVPDEEMYLECTSSAWPAGYLGDGKQGRNVLWLTPEGGELVKTPAHRPGDHGYVRSTDLSVGADGTATYRMHAGFFGAAHETLRMFLRNEADRSEQIETLHKVAYLPDVKGTEYSARIDPDAPRVNLAYATELPRYARKLGKRTFLPLNKFYRFDGVPDPVTDRQFPVVTTKARFYVDTVRLTFPDDLEIESLGETTTTLEHPAGEYRAEVVVAPGKITWIRTYKVLPVQLPAKEYDAYRDFRIAVSKAERRQVVLREKRTK